MRVSIKKTPQGQKPESRFGFPVGGFLDPLRTDTPESGACNPESFGFRGFSALAAARSACRCDQVWQERRRFQNLHRRYQPIHARRETLSGGCGRAKGHFSNKHAALLRRRHDDILNQSDQHVTEIVRRSDRARGRIILADIKADAAHHDLCTR
jgi:hypothetical protein